MAYVYKDDLALVRKASERHGRACMADITDVVLNEFLTAINNEITAAHDRGELVRIYSTWEDLVPFMRPAFEKQLGMGDAAK